MDSGDQPATALVVLLFGLLLLAATALLGGGVLLAEPSGDLLGMPLELLTKTPFRNYFVPGLLLFILLGLGTSAALLAACLQPGRKRSAGAGSENRLHWSWWAVLVPGPLLIAWLGVQIALIGYQSLLQPVFGALGLVLTVLALMPGVREHFRPGSSE